MALYQIIEGDLVPVTWIYDSATRTFTLTLIDPVGTTKTLRVSSVDLAENLGTQDIVINVYDKCFWIPKIVINDGAETTSSPKLKVQVTFEPDDVIPADAPPILYAFICPPLEPLQALRDQNVAPPPDFDPPFQNSTEWYLSYADLHFVDSVDVGPKPDPVPTTIDTEKMFFEYITQPQDADEFWRPGNDNPQDFNYAPTVVRIDTHNGAFLPINWSMTRAQYRNSVGLGFGLWCFIVDIVGNCSIFAFDDILIEPPFSLYYPAEDLTNVRRVHRFHGPRESEKYIGNFDETTYGLGKVLSDAYAQFDIVYDRMTEDLDGRIEGVVTNLRHLIAQRGIK